MTIEEMHKLLKTGFANGSEMGRIADKLRSIEARLQAAEELADAWENCDPWDAMQTCVDRFRAAGKGE